MFEIKAKDLICILKEYKLSWVFNRTLYSLKLKFLNRFPISEQFFEKKVQIKRIDIFRLNVTELSEFIRSLDESHKKKLLEDADNAIAGKIIGFSHVKLNYGDPLEWNLNPITGYKVNPKLKWYQISDFDPVRGDIKVIWEASRFTHFYAFARAYLLTGDKKYYKAFSVQLDDWMKNNPYGYGQNYKCGQECSLRMINGLLIFTLFRQLGLASEKDTENIKKLVVCSYKKILSNFFYAHKCIKNNHTLSELCGMIVGAWCCEDGKQLNKAYYWLDREIEQQFFEDGGYRQYSFTYQRLALQLMELVLKIAPVTGCDLSESSKRRIVKSAKLLYHMQNEQGDVPNYGSNDGALIFPVNSCSYRDFRPVINGILRMIEGVNIYGTGDFEEEKIWFMPEKTDGLEKAILEKTALKPKNVFPQSGYYLLRYKDSKLVVYLQKFSSRPAHMDQLHIDLWNNKINLLCDCGTYTYAEPLGKRLIQTESHNTVKVPGREQMKKCGPFFIYAWTKGRVVTSDETCFSGEMLSKNDYIHRRKIEVTDEGYSILDCVEGADEYDVIFHTPCEVKQEGSGVKLFWNGKLAASLRNENADEMEIRPCYRSLFYLQRETIQEIRFKLKERHTKTTIFLDNKEIVQ